MKKAIYIILFSLLAIKGSAQFTDNFSDGDFTNNPPWSGDVSEFTVNAAKQLQLNNSVAGASYLSANNTMSTLDNSEWRFFIRQSFSPSGSNYGRVYIVSNQANLEGPLNGYYLQFGEAGSLDAVELFRQTGSTSTSVCRGTNGRCATSFSLGIKVTRDAAGLWKLFVDSLGGTNFIQEASGTDLTHTSSLFIGVSTVYTVSNSTKFYFDDFYAGPPILDLAPPLLQNANAISATQLDVLFNEPLDITSAQTGNNYFVNNAVGNPTSAVLDGSNPALVHLTFANNFPNGIPCQLDVNGVADIYLNVTFNEATNFTFYDIGLPNFKDVIINELMADPNPPVGLPNAEYIEIYNRGIKYYNLNGWQISDNPTTGGGTISGNKLIAPGEHVMICSNADTSLFPSNIRKIGVSSFPSLNDAGDGIFLKDNSGNFIDSVRYTSTWYNDPTKSSGGWSLELINPSIPGSCEPVTNWRASVNPNGGTPSQQNSVYDISPDITPPTITSVLILDSMNIRVCFSELLSQALITLPSNYFINNGIGQAQNVSINGSCINLTLAAPLQSSNSYALTAQNISDCFGNPLTPNVWSFSYYIPKPYDIVINELMPDPDPVQGLPNTEYIELKNRKPFDITLRNWKISNLTSSKTIPDVVIPADSFIVLSGSNSQTLFQPLGITVTQITSMPSLTNSGNTITLSNEKDIVIHSVPYSDKWYQDPLKSEGGFSLEMIDPNNPCGGIENWRASMDPSGGTPGRRNSIIANNPDIALPILSRIGVNTPDTITLYFNERTDSATASNVANYTIDNGIGTPVYAIPIGPLFQNVKLVLGSPLQPKIIYTCNVSGIKDCAGNLIDNPNQARFGIPEIIGSGDLVINEIMYDPISGSEEFIELVNRSEKILDLKSLKTANFDTITGTPLNTKTITTEGYLIFPGEYVVISKNGKSIRDNYYTPGPQTFLDAASMPALSASDVIAITDLLNNTIDMVIYTEKMHLPMLSIKKGVSLERIDFNRPSNDRTNWNSASANSGGATPGYKNSQYQTGEGGSTVNVSPEIFSPDNDGYNDVVTISYEFAESGKSGNIFIYDSRGVLIRHLVKNETLGTKGTYSWNGITESNEKAPVGIYIILLETHAQNGKQSKHKLTCVLATKF